MKRFFNNIKNNSNYMTYSATSELKTEVASSFLGWIWWILEPLCFMLIYVFIAQTVFRATEPHFELFVFIGLMIWNFFSKTILCSVGLVKANKGIVTKVYIPKYILLIIKMFVNFAKLMISFAIALIFMIIFGVPFQLSIFMFLINLIVLLIFTFGCASIMMHIGVFVEDLHNVTNIFLRLVFYASGIFFAVATRVPAPWGEILLTINPLAFLIDASRAVLIYNGVPNFLLLGCWLIIGLLLSVFGVACIHKFENTYVKVMK